MAVAFAASDEKERYAMVEKFPFWIFIENGGTIFNILVLISKSKMDLNLKYCYLKSQEMT